MTTTTMEQFQVSRRKPAQTYILWTVQGLLAALFLFAGGTKLVMPVAEMTKQIAMPGAFLRFIGIAEVLGALGLILPGVLRVRERLTPLAAIGLVTIMAGATVLNLSVGMAGPAVMTIVLSALAGTVAYGRWSSSTR